MRILISIPAYDRKLDIELAKTLIFLERNSKHDFDYCMPVSSHLSRNRNYCARLALEGDYDALLFLDSDISINDEKFLDKLIETGFKFDAKVIGGAYLMKKPEEIVYIAGEIKNNKLDNLKEINRPRLVDAVGTGIMLIYREVLEKVKDPWFSILDKPKLEVEPEDFYFCRKAKEVGFNIALDNRFETKHWGAKSWCHLP